MSFSVPRRLLPFNFFTFCLPFQWPKTSNLIFWNIWTFSIVHSLVYICIEKCGGDVRYTRVKFMPSPRCVWVCLISFAKFQCANDEKFIDLLFTKNKKQNTPTQNLILKSCKILPRWTIYFSLHPFHLVARRRKKIPPKRNEFIYLLKCHFLAMSRCFHTQVFYLCFAIIELPSKRKKNRRNM